MPHSDRLIILAMTLIALSSIASACFLEYTGHEGAAAAFLTIAIGCVGAFGPSALKGHSQNSPVDAGPNGQVTINNTDPTSDPAKDEVSRG